jgi:heat shock protein HtpX
MNYIKTTVLLAALTGIFVLIGGWVGGQKGASLALLVAGAMNFVTYWFSDRIVLVPEHRTHKTRRPSWRR